MNKTFLLGLAAMAPMIGFAEAPAVSAFERIVDSTAIMSRDTRAQALAKQFGLNILDVTWEDTGRNKNSVFGPNISDMSIQVHVKGARAGEIKKAVTMPVIRYPNFDDKSADLSPGKFRVLVGNERGKEGEALRSITLTEYLDNMKSYLSKPNSWKGDESSLLAARDSHVLVSAQVSFLPIPKGGEATFNPVLFNYQSSDKNPAVLAILATREGTSATIIDNKRDAFAGSAGAWGQRLFFNHGGQRASLTGKRQSDFAESQNVGAASNVANGESGMNMVLLIQVPLVHKETRRHYGLESFAMSATSRSANVENAVIGHGEMEGPFTEIDDMPIKRDTRFPIRVTVQFYKATDNANLSEADIRSMRAQIDQVFKNADYVGSLVTEGRTVRPTEHQGPTWMPPIWWRDCWHFYSQKSGVSEVEGMKKLQSAYGVDWKRFTNSREKFEAALEFAVAPTSKK